MFASASSGRFIARHRTINPGCPLAGIPVFFCAAGNAPPAFLDAPDRRIRDFPPFCPQPGLLPKHCLKRPVDDASLKML